MCKGLFVAELIGANVSAMPTAGAAGQVWNGKYSLLRYAGEKTGTSLAARQPEPDVSNIYTFVTDCTRGACVSTVVDGPRPANPTLPNTWNGSTWVHIYDWQWDCYLGEGVPKAWNPARSVAYYTPAARRDTAGQLAHGHLRRTVRRQRHHGRRGVSRSLSQCRRSARARRKNVKFAGRSAIRRTK